MDLKEFLQLVTADGLRCIAMQTDVGFVQMPAKTIDDAVRLAEWVDGQKKNCYFALSTFKEEHLNEKGKRRVARKRKNVDQVKSLWVDIDFKDLSGEQTLAGAVAEVKAFLDATGFPKPSAMVSSGNGLHLYWPFDQPVSFEAWRSVSEPFKQLCKAHGLPADHACTADSARVLRPIHTHNWKDPDNPKPVRWVAGSGGTRPISEYVSWFGSAADVGGRGSRRVQESSAIPEHLRKAAASGNAREYTASAKRPQHIKQVFKKCGVMSHILRTGGAEQSEPEWNATLMLLAHLDDGAKFVHKMSEGHHDYDPDITMEKWQQKVEAVEEGSGPTLCGTFEGYHEDICKACPFYKSTKVKTPKSLAYMEPETPPPPKEGTAAPKLTSAAKFQQGQYPKNWRVDGNNTGIERKTWNESSKEYEWIPALRQVWEVKKVCRNIRDDWYAIAVTNRQGTSVREFELAGWMLGTSTDLAKELARYGAQIVNGTEFKNFKDLMSTWIDQLRQQNMVEDITDQLGWIVETDDDGKETNVIGFATGTTAYYLDGSVREGVVSAHSKHKGIVDSFKPAGSLEPWKDAMRAITQQGCDHLIAMATTAFAGPLMRFTEQAGSVVAVVSEDSAAGKSTGMRLAQSVWGNPRHAPATMDDTPTVVKNKLAYLQNLTAYWDEVRGNEEKMAMFMSIAFAVTQGRDRERANSKAETIRAQIWQTLLATASNDSLFNIAAEKMSDSDAGIYRIFEITVPKSDYPAHDAEVMSLVNQLDTNYGHAGRVYAKYLSDNYDEIAAEVHARRLAIEKKFNAEGPERFWIAAITTMLLGAKYANEAGLADFDLKKLANHLFESLQKLRARAKEGKQRLSVRELVAAYAQQHQDGKVSVDWFATGRGGNRKSVLEGNHAHVRKISYVQSVEQNLMCVSKSDFKTWLEKSKHIRMTDKLTTEFEKELLMVEKKMQLAAGTKYALPRAQCLVFDLNPRDEEEDNA